MLHIHKAADPAHPLRLRDRMQTQGRLARTLRPIHLDDAPARNASHAQRYVQAQAARRDRRPRPAGLPPPAS